MAGTFTLIEQARKRLLRQKQLNAVIFFLLLAFSSWILGRLLFSIFPFPYVILFLLPLGCGVLLGATLWKARISVNPEATATLLDRKIKGQDRFLTLVTASHNVTEASFYSIVQQQAERLSRSFLLKQDLPFTVDRRTLISGYCVLFSGLLWLSLPYLTNVQPSLFALPQAGLDDRFQDDEITALENAARRLMEDTATQQEQLAGAQLLALAQQLKDPSLSLQEKEKLVEETRKRIKLDLPFPQLLPFDLKIFASNTKEGKGEGSENNTSQQGKTQSSDTDPSDGQPQQSTSAAALGNASQQEAEQDRGKNKQPQPQNGGGVTFNFPQPQTRSQEQAQQESSGTGQQPSQNQAQQGLTSGTDPNRLGGDQNNQTQSQKNQQGETGETREGQNRSDAGGANVGHGKGQRFLEPGEKAGGGFLTEDARFVKVRVPVGQKTQNEEGKYTENKSRTAPKTPYSNAPLKDAPLERAQAKQPIPLEYRSIFKE